MKQKDTLVVETDRHGGIRIDGSFIRNNDLKLYKGFCFIFTRACHLVEPYQVAATKERFMRLGLIKKENQKQPKVKSDTKQSKSKSNTKQQKRKGDRYA